MIYKLAGEQVYVPDYSVLVQGLVSKFVSEGVINGRIAVHRAIIYLLEQYANKGKVVGFAGLEEIKRLREMHEKGIITLEYVGERPRFMDNNEDFVNNINALIRDTALSLDATLITSDNIQYTVSKALGIRVMYIKPEKSQKLEFEKYFGEDTMSVHLKENAVPVAKVGRPGEWRFVKLSDKPLQKQEIERMANEIIEEAKRRNDAFIEIDRAGSTIIQLGTYRIVITRPPLSDGWEITAVRPLKKLRLEDYNLSPELIKRLNERAEGILIAGAPGMGKTTFAQALAEYYMRMNKIVKTIESPRDMILPADVTQYSKNYADIGELHDILLLSRPDYTVFDEMRNDEDFKLFTDLRLAGIGMIGVVHATSPIDAIQRFIGRVELGMIPSIIDTVIFIKNGQVDKVYEIRMTVKLPTGLKEAELTRPVIEVRDFLTNELEYEIYTFGEQTVVVPVKKLRHRGGDREELLEKARNIIPQADIKIDEEGISVIIRKDLVRTYKRRINRLKKLGEKYGVNVKLVTRD
ncbi:MAG: PINc/VapC family ATPase [Desulfurococcaceae archaeon]